MAVAEIKSHECVTCLQARHEHRHVCLCTGVRLHVDIRCAVKLLEASACEFLHLVNHLATTIITVGRIALGVLVGQHAAHGLQYLVGYVVLAGDKFDTFGLTLTLHADEVKNLLVFGGDVDMGGFGYSRSASLARVPSAHVDYYQVHNLCTADVAVGSGFSPYGKAYGQQTSVDVGVAAAGEAGYTYHCFCWRAL